MMKTSIEHRRDVLVPESGGAERIVAKWSQELLVIIGALSDGRKVVLACESGQRESKESWSRILLILQRRGLKLGRLTVADGHLGIWSALAEQHPEGQEQRCWNHKSMNVVDHLPKTEQPAASQLLHGMAFANSRAACERKRDQFVRRYEKNYPKAAETLLRDWDRMITFYEFPKQHWVHLRTTNIVESPSYCQEWCLAIDSSGGLIDVCHFDSIVEFHSSNDLDQIIESP